MEKAKRIAYAISIAVLLWVVASTIGAWTGNVCKWNIWGLLCDRETETVVTACEKTQGDRYYTVTVEDTDGNQYSYYDSAWQPKGRVIYVIWDGTQIVDTK